VETVIMDMGKLVTLGFSFLNGKFRILEFKQLNHFDPEKYNSGLLQANPA